MADTWRVLSHPRGEWIIETGKGRVAVGPALGRLLQPLDGQAPGEEEIRRHLQVHGSNGPGIVGPEAAAQVSRRLVRILAGRGGGDRGAGRRPVWLRVPLLPATLVGRLVRPLGVLASSRILGAQAAAGVALYLASSALGRWRGWPTGWALVAGLGLFFLTALWHELGHAAALRREGYPPGRVGLGVLFIVPVLFADVSAVAALPRGGRLRVDLAGMAFQLVAGGALGLAGAAWESAPLQLASGLALAGVLWSLIPFIRADGYWALADGLGLDNLEDPLPAGRGRRLLLFMLLHRLANGLFLVLVGLWVPLRLYGWVLRLSGWSGLDPTWLLLPGAIFTGLAWRGLVRRLFLLYAGSRLDVLSLPRR